MLGNILELALRVIPKNSFQYRHFLGGTPSDIGIVAQGYDETWTNGYGLVQPGIISSFGGNNVSEKEYSDLGMDWSKRSCTVWVRNADLHASVNNNSPDQVKYQGRIYNVINVSDWEEYNGWQRVYCQELVNE